MAWSLHRVSKFSQCKKIKENRFTKIVQTNWKKSIRMENNCFANYLLPKRNSVRNRFFVAAVIQFRKMFRNIPNSFSSLNQCKISHTYKQVVKRLQFHQYFALHDAKNVEWAVPALKLNFLFTFFHFLFVFVLDSYISFIVFVRNWPSK